MAELRNVCIHAHQAREHGSDLAISPRVHPHERDRHCENRSKYPVELQHLLAVPIRAQATPSASRCPFTFNDEIQNKTAMNGSDITFLKRKFQETFEVVMDPVEKLDFINILGPTSAQ